MTTAAPPPPGYRRTRWQEAIRQWAREVLDGLQGPPVFGLPMTCAATGPTFIVMVERDGDTLRFRRNVHKFVGTDLDFDFSGFCVEAHDDWQCLYCGARENLSRGVRLFRTCLGEGCLVAPNWVHCVGDREGKSICCCLDITTFDSGEYGTKLGWQRITVPTFPQERWP
jgi:hypothetical protein